LNYNYLQPYAKCCDDEEKETGLVDHWRYILSHHLGQAISDTAEAAQSRV